MGLIKAIGGAVGGVLADQWREYFYCDALDEDILVQKGRKRTSASFVLREINSDYTYCHIIILFFANLLKIILDASSS